MSQGRPPKEVIRVNLLFFAKSRELVGTSSLANFPLATSGGHLTGFEVLRFICERFPELVVIRNSVIIAHNEQYCENLAAEIHLAEGDEIAVIPPIAGGQILGFELLPGRMNYLNLTFDKLQVGEINDLVAHESCGAISLFVGTTRDNFEGKAVVLLEYEAYETMAVKTMNQICDDLRERWPDIKNIGIHHRLGTVPVKEASVVIAVSSPHRQSSLEAVHYAIDELKKSVPVWKKEQYAEGEGSSEWKENKECTWSKSYRDNHIL